MNGLSTVERAFELARSGECANIQELQRRLKREGFGLAMAHLASPSLRKQLVTLIKEAVPPLAAE
ncbi:MAG TPA: hypothetical protein VF582_06280 [Allosphingosinicella sp.]|jgi:hypothetical protein